MPLDNGSVKRVRVPLDVLEYDGYIYSTLDFAPKSDRLGYANKQTTLLQVHPGWELAVDRPGLADAIKKHFWSNSDRLVLADGKAYITRTGVICLEAGSILDILDKNMLMKSGPSYKPAKEAGDARVLIQTRDICEAEACAAHCQDITTRVWKKRRFTDFTLACSGQEILCHRALLVEASPVFESALTTNMRESSEQRLEIKDAEPDVVSAMISFLYTGTLDQTTQDYASLLSLADRYGMDGLVYQCSVQILEKLSADNVVIITRALKGIKYQPRVRLLWDTLQKKLQEDHTLLDALMAGA